jgi:hypothetical protein
MPNRDANIPSAYEKALDRVNAAFQRVMSDVARDPLAAVNATRDILRSVPVVVDRQ